MSRSPVAAPAPELPGYTFERLLGTGGYSDVFLYLKALPRRKVAVKVLREDDSSAAGVATGPGRAGLRLIAEADLMAQLSKHPHIVTIHDAGTAPDGRQFIVMEYYPGDTLARRAKRETMTVTDVLHIGIQLSGAVETAHQFGIIHRDIKPANILTDQSGRPRLTDFGIAGRRDEDQGGGGMSLPWSPPEVVRGHAVPDELSDVYSLGATLWNLLAGRSPFELPGGDNSELAISRRIETDPVPWIGRQDVPSSFERVLQQAMAKTPQARFGSAMALAVALQAVQQELGQAVIEPEVLRDDDRMNDTSRRVPFDADGDATNLKQRVHAHASMAAPVGRPNSCAPLDESTAVRSDGLIRDIDPSGRVWPLLLPDPSSNARSGIPAPPTVSDIGRDGPSPYEAAPDAPDEPAAGQPTVDHRPRPKLLIAVVLGVVATVTVGVVMMSHRGSVEGDASSIAPPTPSAQDLLAAAPLPGTPQGTGRRVSATKAHFTWSVAAPGAVTFYIVRRSDTGSGPRPDGEHITKAAYDLTGIAPASTPCLDVQSGNDSGATSAPVRICAPSRP